MNETNWTPCHRLTQPSGYMMFNQIVNGLLTSVCVAVGTIGNLHSIRSMHLANFDKHRGVVLAVSVLALATWDTVLLWSAFFYYSLKALTRNANEDWHNVLVPWVHPCSQIANTASIWCVVAITTRRFMASRDPFRRKARTNRLLLSSFRNGGERRSTSSAFIYCSTYRRHFRMPVLLSLLAIIVNVPAFFEFYSIVCFDYETDRFGAQLVLAPLRRNATYKLWYRVVFRMLISSCGPNVYILLLTGWTLFLLRGTNRSRRRLFHFSETLQESFSNKETLQTMISVILVVKFLLFRSLAFAIDLWEVIFGFRGTLALLYGEFRYHIERMCSVLDVSNFLVILNSATNCLVFLRASHWLQQKVQRRSVQKRKNNLNSLQFLHKGALLDRSWSQVLRVMGCQFGVRVLYAMLRNNPNLLNFLLVSDTSMEGIQNSDLKIVSRQSFDLLTNTKFLEIGQRIVEFFTQLIEMMRNGSAEEEIVQRIRRVGAVHFEKGIAFSSSVWREFKTSTLVMVGESCEFDTELERQQCLEAWSSFLSVIIKEMKMGIWALAEPDSRTGTSICTGEL